jgi:hypothetical protein
VLQHQLRPHDDLQLHLQLCSDLQLPDVLPNLQLQQLLVLALVLLLMQLLAFVPLKLQLPLQEVVPEKLVTIA